MEAAACAGAEVILLSAWSRVAADCTRHLNNYAPQTALLNKMSISAQIYATTRIRNCNKQWKPEKKFLYMNISNAISFSSEVLRNSQLHEAPPVAYRLPWNTSILTHSAANQSDIYIMNMQGFICCDLVHIILELLRRWSHELIRRCTFSCLHIFLRKNLYQYVKVHTCHVYLHLIQVSNSKLSLMR
jgi:hypothetical protein